MNLIRRVFRGQRSKVTQAIHSDPEPTVCPYCGALLNVVPVRSRTCPHCKEFIVVRTDRATKEKLLLTEVQARELDGERKKQAARNKALRAAINMGCTADDFQQMEQSLTERLGVALPGDVFWALADQTIREPMLQRDWHRVGVIEWSRARWLYEEGRNHIQHLRESHAADLKARAANSLTGKVRILTNGDAACAECRGNDGTVFSIDSALLEMPLPVEECENGWCQCIWSPVTYDSEALVM